MANSTNKQQHPSTTVAVRNLQLAADIERATDWTLARLIASSVELGQAGRPAKESRSRTAISKVSVTLAEKILGKAHQTIRAYLKAWDAAAADGHCTPSSDLAPEDGQTAELPASHLWERYRNPNSHSTPRSTGTIPADPIEAIANYTPAQKTEVAKALLSEPTVATEVMGDTKTSANVSHASQRAWEQREARAEQMDRDHLGGLGKRAGNATRQASFQYELTKATAALNEAGRKLADTDLTGDEKDQARHELGRIRIALGWIESHLDSGAKSIDTELAELLGGAE